MLVTDLDSQQVDVTVTIPAGSAFSPTLNLRGLFPFGSFMPAAWTAATCGLQASIDGVTWVSMNSSSGATQSFVNNVTVGTFQALQLAASFAVGGAPRFMRLWSNTAGVDTVQAADRTFVIACLPLQVRRP